MDKPVHALLRPPGSTQRCQTGRRLHAAVVCGWQNRCSWRCIDVYTLFFGFVDRVLICCRPSGRWLWITHMPPKLGEWDHESGYFSIRTVKDLDLMWEIRQQSQKLCRLRSQRGSNKNESVCLCVVCACHQKTLREVLLLLTLYGETSGWISSMSGPAAIKTEHNMARPAWPNPNPSHTVLQLQHGCDLHFKTYTHTCQRALRVVQ